MAKHPGGQDILLGVLGRDATVEFETMRHSQIALKQLRGRKDVVWSKVESRRTW
jgi:cytochrome b involved in lipid metabolism